MLIHKGTLHHLFRRLSAFAQISSGQCRTVPAQTFLYGARTKLNEAFHLGTRHRVRDHVALAEMANEKPMVPP